MVIGKVNFLKIMICSIKPTLMGTSHSMSLNNKRDLLYIITLVILFFSPKTNYGATPPLGKLANFAIFTTNGAVTSKGKSQITGNIGTNKGSITGFGNVNGTLYNGDTTTSKCMNDLGNLYNKLDSTATTNTLTGSTIGNGDTLFAGVYSLGGATSLKSALYLDGKGKTNGIFIFKIKGALSTSASSSIILINGASVCNIFWKIEGKVEMATGTKMKGTVLANNGAITTASGVDIEGRIVSTTGAITLDATHVYTPNTCGSVTLTGPIAPLQRTAECYAILSESSDVTNSGTTNVIGDVGTNVGKTSGFVASNVKGKIHTSPDASTAQASKDLTKIYNYLDSLKTDIELLYPAQFGRSLVLTPHTYLLNVSTTLEDTLFLNGLGNSNAVFVIKIKGAFSTTTGKPSYVKLINGTQSKNIFWVVDGAVSLDSSSFNGTIVANNAAISLKHDIISGRALTTKGSIITNSITITAPSTCSTSSQIVITSQPKDNEVCAGNSATFSVLATGTGLSYQWRKGNTNLSNGGNISGATSSSLVINPVKSTDAASNYNVIVSSSASPNDTSNNSYLKVNVFPVITANPKDQKAVLGKSASFSVTATGSSITYQWRKGKVNLKDGANISGSTSSKLTINKVTSLDTIGYYSVVVDGICGNPITSDSAKLSSSVITGIESFLLGNTETVVMLYPNPFKDVLNIKINDYSALKNCSISLYNSTGERVFTRNIVSGLSVLETGNLASGIYFYSVLSNNKIIQSGKIISQY